MSQELYDQRQALILGRRRVCYDEGHRWVIAFDDGLRGGVQGDLHKSWQTAACDAISCKRCDVVFTATYPLIAPENSRDPL